MPRLTVGQLDVIKQAGDLMQRLIETGNLEEGTDERFCFNGLSYFFKAKDISEWEGELTHEEWHIITQQTIAYLERTIEFSRLFMNSPA